MSTRRTLFAAPLICALGCVNLFGQATSGNIIGTVTDPAGAVVPNVKITITSQNRGAVYNTTTNESGNYSQLQILPGPYTIQFEAAGFQRFVQNNVTSVWTDRRASMPNLSSGRCRRKSKWKLQPLPW